MASEVITYVITSEAYRPESIAFPITDATFFTESPLGGSIKTIEIPGTWMYATLNYGIQRRDERAEMQGFWAGAGLRRNRVLLHHLALEAPRGTMRGSPLVKTAVAAGAESVVLKNMNGTLKRGDPIGLTDGLHFVLADVTPVSSEGTVKISPQARAAIAADSAVTWDKPQQRFVCLEPPEVPFSGTGTQPPFSVRLVEIQA